MFWIIQVLHLLGATASYRIPRGDESPTNVRQRTGRAYFLLLISGLRLAHDIGELPALTAKDLSRKWTPTNRASFRDLSPLGKTVLCLIFAGWKS